MKDRADVIDLAQRAKAAQRAGDKLEGDLAASIVIEELAREARVMGLTAEQLEMRRTGIGGSEIAAVVGQNPYSKPIDVFAAKVHGETFDSNHHTERGMYFELPTAQWCAARHGGVLRPGKTIRHPTRPRVLCTPDFILSVKGQPDVALQVKAPSPGAAYQWGEPGKGDPPAQYVIQVQYELAILGALEGIKDGVIVAVLDGDLAEYPVKGDPELQAMLMDAAERFWRDHVETGLPPEPDASENYAAFLKRKFLVEPAEKLRKASPDVEAWAQRLRVARAAKERAEAEEELARQHLEAFIGADAGVEGDGWSIRWGWNKGKPSTDWKSLCAGAGIPQEVVDRFTTRQPHRVFTPKFGGKK